MSAEDGKDEEKPRAKQFKVIIVGDGAVGKTSMALRFVDQHFTGSYKQTLGVDFFSKRIELPGDLEVTLQIWDIGGQSIGSKMIKNYIYGAHAVLLVYDVTNYDSFRNLEDWYRLVRQTFKNEKMPTMALVGNKSDLDHIRAVKNDDHFAFADENHMFSFRMSAKSGDQVNTCFVRVAATLAGVSPFDLKGHLEEQARIISGSVVNYQQHDPDVAGGELPAIPKRRTGCVIS